MYFTTGLLPTFLSNTTLPSGNLFGNSIRARSTISICSPPVIRIDWITLLPSGYLKNFYIHASEIIPTVGVPNPGLLPPTDRFIRVQIWRLLNETISEFQLVWEKRYGVPAQVSGVVKVSIGWQPLTITYKHKPEQSTLCSQVGSCKIDCGYRTLLVEGLLEVLAKKKA